ncbi:hypothetical protein Cni_G07890 [Canna indica]|uniref:Uncharacterized protein n=1 Tax=Canna indica TaxID=4628 RepID=A0AAQ3K140_9LILI|nr:hypothetical protein Cni_G07890 [Canna indica]
MAGWQLECLMEAGRPQAAGRLVAGWQLECSTQPTLDGRRHCGNPTTSSSSLMEPSVAFNARITACSSRASGPLHWICTCITNLKPGKALGIAHSRGPRQAVVRLPGGELWRLVDQFRLGRNEVGYG